MASLIPAGDPPLSPERERASKHLVAEVFLAYRSLLSIASSIGTTDLARRLVLCEPLSVAGEAPLVAASIAGAASLCIETDARIIRQSIRSGAIDFTVNNLDEALRALKNEIRKGMSIAVCLEGDPMQVMPEMVARGVQPDVVCGAASSADPWLKTFVDRGALPLKLNENGLPEFLTEIIWQVRQLPGKWLPMVDELVASSLPPEDTLRRNWLKRAPRYLGRALRTTRYLPMSAGERSRCEELLRTAFTEEKWAGAEVDFGQGRQQALSS